MIFRIFKPVFRRVFSCPPGSRALRQVDIIDFLHKLSVTLFYLTYIDSVRFGGLANFRFFEILISIGLLMRNTVSKSKQGKSLGFKLALTNFALTAALTGALVGAIGYAVSTAIEQSEKEDLLSRSEIMMDMIQASDKDLRTRAQHYSKAFRQNLNGEIALVPDFWVDLAGHQTPAMLINGNLINGQTHLVDSMASMTGARFTVFAKQGDEFYRVSTSLLDDKGARSVGTKLDKSTPAYKSAIQGKPYTGLVRLFGKEYMSHYEPLYNAKKEMIGMTLSGMDFSDLMSEYKQAISNLKIEETGYYFVVNSDKTSPEYGNVVLPPSLEGVNMLNVTDNDGNLMIRDMLEKEKGVMSYVWSSPETGEAEPREKIAAYVTIPEWNWMIGGGTSLSEFTGHVSDMIKLFAALGLAGLIAVSALWLALIRKMVSKPIHEVIDAADAIAAGDLTGRIRSQRTDEIGHLVAAINQINDGITSAVNSVRENAQAVAGASTQMANSNAELSARTESQAAALTQTAASTEEMEATVKQNADNAQAANQLANQAADVVKRGSDVVGVAVDTMQGIHQSSKKIEEIVGVIDSIAFQTNILALNAAVEAARAGEQGKGFAVVASEVRNLSARSAAAAKEIKDLIQDSVSRVEQGTLQVNEVGATMQDIMQSITRVNDIMGEISTASNEQSDGVGQIAQAISQIDGVTQQNVSQVEQMSQATQQLRDQAEALVNAVAAFKTGTSGQRAVSHGLASASPGVTIKHHAPVAATVSTAPSRLVAQPALKPVAKPALPVPARRGGVKEEDDFVEW